MIANQSKNLQVPESSMKGISGELEEIANDVRAAVERLPERYRDAVILRYWSGLSYEQIAFKMGIPLNTVGVRLLRASKLLRDSLKDLAP